MIAHLRGKLIHKEPGQIIVEAAGVGYAAMEFSRVLFDGGVMAIGIAFPKVHEGKARIHAIVTSEHTRAQLDQALGTTERVAKRIGILG